MRVCRTQMDVFSRLEVICIFMVFTVTAVNSIDQVTGDIGGDVLLPCVYTGGDVLEKVTAFWRDKDDKNVLDIKEDAPDIQFQHENFKGRVKTFPDLYKKGNFSIVLSDLQKMDSGIYECDVLKVEYKNKVNLIVSDKRAVATPRTATTTTTAAAAKGPSGAAPVSLNSLCLTLLSVPLSLLLLP